MPFQVMVLIISCTCHSLLQQDQFGRLLPTFIQIIDLTEEEEEEYWMVVSAIFEGKETSSIPSESNYADKSSPDPPSSTPLGDPINNKVSVNSVACLSTKPSKSEKGKLVCNHCVAAVLAQFSIYTSLSVSGLFFHSRILDVPKGRE